MGDMFEYISWRGDLSFSDVPFGPVDALVFSTLVYLRFEGIVPQDMKNPVPLHVAADAFSSLTDGDTRVRSRSDLALLQAAAGSERFQNTRLCCYRSRLLEQEQTQFAAMPVFCRTVRYFLRSGERTIAWWDGRKILT